MKAVLFADRNGEELKPLTELTCVALLPVVGKPLILHSIEALALAGIQEILIAVSSHADALESLLGTGRRWGMEFEFVLTRGEEWPDTIMQRLGTKWNDDVLMIRGDILRSPILHTFLEKSNRYPNRPCHAIIRGSSAGICLVRNGGEPSGLWKSPQFAQTCGEVGKALEIEDAELSYIDNLGEYHRANLDALAGRYPGLRVPGYKVADGIYRGRGSRLPIGAITKREVLVGANCNVHQEVELLDQVVLADGIIVDRKARIQSSVILSNSYIGQLVEVTNAIVCPPYLIRVDTGAITKITDAFLLCDLTHTPARSLFLSLFHRLIGVIVLLLSFPLWIFAGVAAWCQNPKRPTKRITLIGNRIEVSQTGGNQYKTFETLEFETNIPLFRHLPKVWAVVAGHIRFIGVTPLSPKQSEHLTEEWEHLRSQAPRGLLGPVQLLLSQDTPEEEWLLAEAYYAQTRSLIGDLRLMLRGGMALFKPATWWSSRPASSPTSSTHHRENGRGNMQKERETTMREREKVNNKG